MPVEVHFSSNNDHNRTLLPYNYFPFVPHVLLGHVPEFACVVVYSIFAVLYRRNYHPPGYDHKGKKQQEHQGYPKPPSEQWADQVTPPKNEQAEDVQNAAAELFHQGREVPEKTREGEASGGIGRGGDGGSSGGVLVGKGMARNIGLGAFGKSQEIQRYELPSDWKNTVSNLCLRTNFEPAELADLFQTFRQLAGGFYFWL